MRRLSVESTDGDGNLDDILLAIGRFGSYQKVTCLLLFMIMVISVQSAINYMVTTNTLEYRCKVPECEFGPNNRDLPFNQTWLTNAIPLMENGKFDSCHRYAPMHTKSGECSANMFNTSRRIACREYVYASDEKNVQTEFNIHCSKSTELALVSTVASIARIIFLPLSGYISDRFGRIPCFIIGTGIANIFGLIKTFSISYLMYCIFQFLESSAYSFAGLYVFVIELLNEKDRVYGNTVLALGVSVGSLLFGVAVMFEHDFRVVLRMFHIPGIFVLFYFLFISESVHWLLATGRIDRAISIIKRIARFNRLELSEKAIESIKLKYSSTTASQQKANQQNVNNQSVLQLFWMMLKTRTLCLRFLNICYQWIATYFSNLGLYQYSIQVPGVNRYVSYLIMISADIPGTILVQLLLNRVKRKTLLFSAHLLTGICIIITSFIPKEYPWIVIGCFVIAKSLLHLSTVVMNMFTSELFPTNIRTTVLNIASTCAQIGSMLAPFIIIMGAQLSHNVPAFLFGGAAISVAFSVLLSPETFRKKLPETIVDAIKL